MMSVRAYVDRIEGNVGVLLLGEQEHATVDFPLAFLPADVKEGMVLHLNFVRDKDEQEEEESTYRAVENLRDRLMHRGPVHDDHED